MSYTQMKPMFVSLIFHYVYIQCINSYAQMMKKSNILTGMDVNLKDESGISVLTVVLCHNPRIQFHSSNTVGLIILPLPSTSMN